MANYDELIKKGRDSIRFREEGEEFKSHQQLRLPQPPLVKAKMSDIQIDLPMDFKKLKLKNDILSLIFGRESHRVYSGEAMTMLQLSFLLWATQGIKSIRGNNYATLRTVPCGGARHEFETYLAVRNVDGLEPGKYHYLPMTNQIEFLGKIDDNDITASLMGQSWGAKANVVFYWAIIPYRSEWRYGVHAHRPTLIDVGHIGQNLYIGCEAAGLGTCGIAAFDVDKCSELFSLDTENEFVVYTAPVGTIASSDKDEELNFYSFTKDEPGAQNA